MKLKNVLPIIGCVVLVQVCAAQESSPSASRTPPTTSPPYVLPRDSGATRGTSSTSAAAEGGTSVKQMVTSPLHAAQKPSIGEQGRGNQPGGRNVNYPAPPPQSNTTQGREKYSISDSGPQTRGTGQQGGANTNYPLPPPQSNTTQGREKYSISDSGAQTRGTGQQPNTTVTNPNGVPQSNNTQGREKYSISDSGAQTRGTGQQPNTTVTNPNGVPQSNDAQGRTKYDFPNPNPPIEAPPPSGSRGIEPGTTRALGRQKSANSEKPLPKPVSSPSSSPAP